MEKSLRREEEIFVGHGFSRGEGLAIWAIARGREKIDFIVIPSAARDPLFRKSREKSDSSGKPPSQ
jgi:hypothetical protein